MARFVTHVRSPLPVDEAFDYMSDLTNFARWDPGVRRVDQVVGAGPGRGSEYDVEVDGIGGTMTLRYRVTSHRPPREVVAEASTSLLRSYDQITVSPTETDGSVVTYDAELTLRGVLALADPLLGPVFDRIGRKAEKGLVEALNGERIDDPGPVRPGGSAGHHS